MPMCRLPSLLMLLLWLAAIGVGSSWAQPAAYRDYAEFYLPEGGRAEGGDKVPLVIMLEGTGGSRAWVPNAWTPWLNQRGIATVQIRSAAARKRPNGNWSGTGCDLFYRYDAAEVLELARLEQPRIDTMRYAVMGFSRGGTEALNTRKSFPADRPPTAVFSFYPGCEGYCPSDYTADGPTQVHILYGDADDWGQHKDSYGRCKRLAGGKIQFHSFAGAPHGFDGTASGVFTASNMRFGYGPHPEAREQARALVWQVLSQAWSLQF